MKDLCEYVTEADADWASSMWAGSDAAAYADFLAGTIHENQLAERIDKWISAILSKKPETE